MDDTNILTLGDNTKSITSKLRWIYSRCLYQAKRYSALFSLKKYSLLYIYKGNKKKKDPSLLTPITLDKVPIIPSLEIRILGIYLNNTLTWKNNTLKVKERVLERFGVLAKSTYSTRGFPPLVARVVYIAAIRAILSYGVGIQLNTLDKGSLSILGKL